MAEPFRILILEDNPADAKLVQFELQEAGFVFTAKVVMTKKDFVSELQDFSPDLILSDYDLPQFNGALALAEARKRCPDTPFILVTGAVTEDRAIEILTQGAKDYVLKSRLQQRLVPAVRRALAEAEEHKARKRAEEKLREANRTLEERVKIRTAELETEIAARKKMEEERERLLDEVQNRAAELDATISSMATGLIVYNAAGKAIRMNNTAKELLPQEIFFNMTVEERARVIRWETEKGQPFPLEEIPVARALRGETTHNVVIAASFPNRKLWISASAAPIRTPNGQMVGVVASFIDITERKRAEDTLQTMLQRLHALVSNLHSSILFVGKGGIELANQAFCDYFELQDAPADLIGLTPGKLIEKIKNVYLHPEEAITRIQEIIDRGQPVISEEVVMRGERICLRDFIPIHIDEKSFGRLWHHTDITERKNREKEQEKLNRTLRALNKSNQAMMHATDECKYMEEVCKILVEDCGYTMIWVGLAHDDEGKTVRPVTYSGFEDGYINALKVTWADTERGRGPTGTAIRTGNPTVCRNMLTDPRFQPWREEAIKRGYASSIALPLMADGKAFGALTIYSKEPDHFAEDEVKLLAELANDLSYGILAIRLRAARARAEEALQESEERFRTLAENIPDLIARFDRNLRLVYANPAVFRRTGLPREALVGRAAREYGTSPMAADDWEMAAREVLDSGKIRRYEHTNQWQGETRVFDVQVVPERDANGAVQAVIAISRDITERKRTEDAVRQSEERYRTLFNTLIEGFCIIEVIFDAHGRPIDYRFLEINPAFERQTGLYQARGKLMRDLVPDHEDHWFEIYGKIALTGEPARFTNEARALNRWYDVSAFRLGGSESRKVAILFNDITERKLAEDQLVKQAAQLQEHTAQLEELNQELESFSYSVSHDLRSPLRAIDGFSRKLEREYGDKLDEKFADTVNVIRSNTKLMGVLIDDLLAFSRVQKTGMSISAIDMDKLVGEVWKEIREANKERELKLKITKILPGYGDQPLIKQVLFNLFDNAVKFTKNRKQGIVEMSSYKEADKVVYYIKDNGAGFDMAYYNKLFGVFQRLHSPEEYEGTGVGLAIVQRIINRHGGRVWAEGKVDKGATFYFTLPAHTSSR